MGLLRGKGLGGSMISPLTNTAKLSMSSPVGAVLSLIQGSICKSLHCIYTKSILTVQLNTDTGKTKKNLKFTNSQLNALSRYVLSKRTCNYQVSG